MRLQEECDIFAKKNKISLPRLNPHIESTHPMEEYCSDTSLKKSICNSGIQLEPSTVSVLILAYHALSRQSVQAKRDSRSTYMD